MPIRTPRGRSSAYRAIWQWPLHSPLRLALSLVVLLAVAVGISLVITANRPPDSTTGASSSSTATPSSGSVSRPPASPTVLPPVAPLTPSPLPLEQAPQPALQAAAAWAAAWVNHPDGVSAQQWLAGLRPYTTDEYLGLLGTVDPSKVPANRIVGSPVPTQAAPASVQARVQTDTIALLVLVVDTGPGTGWRVADSDEA